MADDGGHGHSQAGRSWKFSMARAHVARWVAGPSRGSRSPAGTEASPAPEDHDRDQKDDDSADIPSSQNHAAMTAGGLTFYERFFTKPVDNDTEKSDEPRSRRFAFFTRGVLVISVIMLLILAGVIAAAVVVATRDDGAKHKEASPNTADTPPNEKPPHTEGDSPIRAALMANFPDPAILHDNGTFYAYATNNAAGVLNRPASASFLDYGASNIQLATSPDFTTWDLQTSASDPLPSPGLWTVQGTTAITGTSHRLPRANIWAPAILKRPSDGQYILYYSGARNTHNHPPHNPGHCIGAAIAPTPTGPFTPTNSTLICPLDLGGAIDAAPFLDPTTDTLYLTYKIDGNNLPSSHGGPCNNALAPHNPTPILLQKMLPDGLTLADEEPVQLLDRESDEDDGPLIEAPELYRSDEGVYFLFFSSGCTRADNYDVKYATSTEGVGGPYQRAEGRLLQTGDWGLTAPGGAAVVSGGDGVVARLAFHARVGVEGRGRVRGFFTAGLVFEGTGVRLVREGGVGGEDEGGGEETSADGVSEEAKSMR